MHKSEKASQNPLLRQRTKSKEERRVKFPQEIVFDEMVKEGDSSEIVNFMRRESVDVDINKRNEHGNTALNEMIKNGNLKCVKVLIGLGADVNRKDEKGQTPLHYASQHGSLSAAKYLLETDADPDIADNTGKCPVDYTDDFEMIELLMSYSGVVST